MEENAVGTTLVVASHFIHQFEVSPLPDLCVTAFPDVNVGINGRAPVEDRVI